MLHYDKWWYLRLSAEEEYRDSVGVDDTWGLHEQVQGGQQERRRNIGGVGELKTSQDIFLIM